MYFLHFRLEKNDEKTELILQVTLSEVNWLSQELNVCNSSISLLCNWLY